MAQFTEEPAKIVLMGNKITYKIKTDAHLNTVGSKATAEAVFNINDGDTFSAGEYLDILIENSGGDTVEYHRYVFRTDPELGNELPTNVDNHTVENYVALILEYLQYNTKFLPYLDMWQNASSSIKIREKDIEGKTIQFGPSTGASITVSNTAGIAYDEKDGRHFLNFSLVVKYNNETHQALTRKYIPDRDTEIELDVSEILKSYQNSAITWPESSTDVIIEHNDFLRPFFARAYDENFDNQEISEFRYAVPGGQSFRKEAQYNNLNTSFYDKLGSFNILDTGKQTREMPLGVKGEKMFFLNNTDSSELRVKAKYYNANTTQITQLGSNTSPEKYAVYEILVGYALNTDNIPISDITSVDIYLTDESDTTISETRSYRINRTFYPYERRFIYENSYGVIQFLWSTGKTSEYTKLERTTAEQKLPSDFTQRDFKEFVTEVNSKDFIEASIFVSEDKDDVEALKDFMLSKQVYEIMPDGRLLPVIIETTEMNPAKDGELYVQTVEYRHAFDDEYHSRELVASTLSGDFNDDYAKDYLRTL